MMVYSIFRYSWLIILKNCFDFHELAIESWMVFLLTPERIISRKIAKLISTRIGVMK